MTHADTDAPALFIHIRLTAKKPNTGSGTGAGVFGATRRSGSRAAAQRASSRFVESQAQDDNEDDDFEMSFD